MRGYTVKQLARLAAVSVRTLHHYDHIGLLKPRTRTEAGYRMYGQEELLRLQQILLFRELEVPLAEIARILAEPGFDPVRALRAHRTFLESRLGRLHQLLETVDRTLAQYSGGDMLSDEELYRGFTPEDAARMRKEARELWGEDAVEASERKVRSLSKEDLAAVRREGEGVSRDLAALVGRDPGDDAVQAVVARHHAWVGHFWSPGPEAYRGLGRLYVEHPEFRAHYESYAPGLAEFLHQAIERYCDRHART